MGYENLQLVSPHVLGGGGLALLWSNEINLEVLSKCQNYIDTRIKYRHQVFFTTFIYGEPDRDKRK